MSRSRIRERPMAITHNLGFPRIGAQRELKFALEACWAGRSSAEELQAVGAQLRAENWSAQNGIDYVPVGDFSFYDHVLDTSFMLGNVPERVSALKGDPLDDYFRVARGRSAADGHHGGGAHAGEMAESLDTTDHYIVPEFHAETRFSLDAAPLLAQLAEARAQGVKAKPVLVGPVTYLWLGKAKDDSDKLALLQRLLPVYRELLQQLARQGVEWVQIDEPVLVTRLSQPWRNACATAYAALKGSGPKLLLTTYFGTLQDNLSLACELPVQGLHIDAVNARAEVDTVVSRLAQNKVLSIGAINGRNVWKTDLNATLDWLEPLHAKLGDRLWLAPSCSLLHVPVDLDTERKLDPEIRQWLAFARQKLEELKVIATALDRGREAVRQELDDNRAAVESRRASTRVHNPAVKAALARLSPELARRKSPYAVRAPKQAALLKLPPYPTTTIGSFPQTAEIRQARRRFRNGELDAEAYREAMQAEIARCVREQEALGLDVLVHGEAERNDMVEYFGELLAGYVFTESAWVQSYGSCCVKPPRLSGDANAPHPIRLESACSAQSLTYKPVKGMLPGPVTILNWSFVRDDQPRSVSGYLLALALRQEVLDLEAAGIRVIQIDEAALREGLPLRRSEWAEYLQWAV